MQIPSFPHYSFLIPHSSFLIPVLLPFNPHSFQNEYSTLTTAYPSIFQSKITLPPTYTGLFSEKHSFRLEFFLRKTKKTNTLWETSAHHSNHQRQRGEADTVESEAAQFVLVEEEQQPVNAHITDDARTHKADRHRGNEGR